MTPPSRGYRPAPLSLVIAGLCLVLLWSFGLMRGGLDPAGLAMMALLSVGIVALAVRRPAGPPGAAGGKGAADRVAGLEAEVEALTARNEDLTAFAKAASHDMKEPLRKIEQFGQRVMERLGPLPDERIAHHVERMIDGASRLRVMIEDLRTHSRINETRLPDEAVALGGVVDRAVGALGSDADGAAIAIAPDLPTVKGDAVQLQLLFAILLGNALKYAKPGAPARIDIRVLPPEGGCAVIDVCDEGIGFDPRHADRIFGLFERLHTRADYPGNGIGLATCRRIAERHGGRVTARGEPENGAVFTLILPLARANLANETPTSRRASQ